MSDRMRTKITKELLDKEFVPIDVKNRALSTVLYDTVRTNTYMGTVLQCMNIMYTHQIPTAGINFNNEAKRWDLYINPKFFCEKLNYVKDDKGRIGQAAGDLSRKAILLHELAHITNKHPMRVPFLKISPHKRHLMNIAADMAINQYIKNIPKGCPNCPPPNSGQKCQEEMCPGYGIHVEDWYDEEEKADGSIVRVPWKVQMPMEYYYEKLLTKLSEGDKTPDTIDEHMWDGSGEEKDMLEATEDLLRRAMIKARFGHDELPDSIKDLLEHIKTRRAELDYRAVILSAIKKSASGHERKHTWTRKSRRFGSKAPGTKVGDLPKLNMYLDSSGSISVEEMNEFLEIVDNFLKAGSRKCRLNLFHTTNYYSEEYKLGQRLNKEVVESGGTCLKDSMIDIIKRQPDLAIFVTDGYYGDVEVEQMISKNQRFPQCLFIISREGAKDHPLKRLGRTVQIPAGFKSKGDKK